MNPNLLDRIGPYRQQYIDHGYTVIPDFLTDDYAETIWNNLRNAHPGFWKKIVLLEEKMIGCPSQSEHLHKLRNLAQYKAVEGEFTFCYGRNDIHDDLCYCNSCLYLRKIGQSQEMIDFIRETTGEAITSAGHELFFSKYTEEDFLTLHSDYNKGKIAFILNLTKDWQPYYGGLLHILEDNKMDVKATIVPKFNQLTVMKIPEGGVPHFVSHVAPYVKSHRYSMAGWFR